MVIVADIHDSDESRHSAGKPRIRPIVCGSGFSEGLIIFNTRPRSRAPIDGLCQHGPNGNRCFRCDGTNKLRTVLLQNLSIAVGDLQNAVRFHLFSVICKAAVGHGHFKRRNACRSEGEGEVIRHVWGGYPHFLSHRFDICNPDNLSQPHDNGIDRLRQCLYQRDLSRVFHIAVFGGPPVCKIQRGVQHSVDGAVAVLHCRCVDNGFEGGSGLSESLRRTVKFTLIEIASAYKGKNLSRIGIQGYQRPLVGQFRDNFLCLLLEIKIDGRADSETSAVNRIRAVLRQ